MPISFLCAEADETRKVDGQYVHGPVLSQYCLSNLASPSKEEGAGGDELKTGRSTLSAREFFFPRPSTGVHHEGGGIPHEGAEGATD